MEMIPERQLLMSRMSDLALKVQEKEMSKQDAIDELIYIRDCIDSYYVAETERKQIKALTMAIESLRRGTPDFHADWQPISDGLLPDAGEYFVTWEAKNSGSRFIEIAEYFMNEYGDMVWDVSRMEANGYHDIKIIAWMDMPKRWDGE